MFTEDLLQGVMVLDACANVRKRTCLSKGNEVREEEAAQRKSRKASTTETGMCQSWRWWWGPDCQGPCQGSSVKPLSHVSVFRILWLWAPLSFLEPLLTLAGAQLRPGNRGRCRRGGLLLLRLAYLLWNMSINYQVLKVNETWLWYMKLRNSVTGWAHWSWN